MSRMTSSRAARPHPKTTSENVKSIKRSSIDPARTVLQWLNVRAHCQSFLAPSKSPNIQRGGPELALDVMDFGSPWLHPAARYGDPDVPMVPDLDHHICVRCRCGRSRIGAVQAPRCCTLPPTRDQYCKRQPILLTFRFPNRYRA